MPDGLFSQSVSFLLFLAGALLLVAEAFAPGAHFFVLGVALLTAGIVGLLLPATVGGPLAVAVLAVTVLAATGLTLWAYRKVDFYGGEGAAQTLDSASLRGTFGRVTERVTGSSGEVKLEEGGFHPYYQARSVGDAIEEGTEVMVVDPGGGNVLEVEPVASGDDIDRELARERASGSNDGGRTVDDRADGSETGGGEETASDDDERDVESDRAS